MTGTNSFEEVFLASLKNISKFQKTYGAFTVTQAFLPAPPNPEEHF
jgi:hypothetical protein